jgi:hypothetical protein
MDQLLQALAGIAGFVALGGFANFGPLATCLTAVTVGLVV